VTSQSGGTRAVASLISWAPTARTPSSGWFFSVQNESVCLKNECMTFNRNIGMLLLAIYLILVGIISLAGGLAIPPVLTGILALIAGIFILIGR
jgi:hypothetical protein